MEGTAMERIEGEEKEKLISAEDRLFDPKFAFWIDPIDTPTHKIIRLHVYVGNEDAKGTINLSYKPYKPLVSSWTPLESIDVSDLMGIYFPDFVYTRYVDIPRSEPGTYIFMGEFRGEWPWRSVVIEEKVEVEPMTPSSTPTVRRGEEEMSEEKQNLTALWRAAMNGEIAAVLKLLTYNNVRYIRAEDIKLIFTIPGKPVDPERSYQESIEMYMSNLKLTLEASIYKGEVQRLHIIIEPLYHCDRRD